VKQISVSRKEFGERDSWRKPTLALTGEPAAASDDEYDGAQECYNILTNEARNPQLRSFWHEQDARRIQMGKARGRHMKTERNRVAPEVPVMSRLDRIPNNVPIDWFSPGFFNNMPAKDRYQFRDNGIGLPLAPRPPTEDWIHLTNR
jgi:hypothetical protein